MSLVFNPWSNANATGAVVTLLSPCLLALNWVTDSWSIFRTPFSIALTVGLLLLATYRRIEVREDRSGFEVRMGLWPLVFRTRSVTCDLRSLVVDAYYQRTLFFTVHLEYRDGKERRVKLLNSGPEALRLVLLASKELDLPVELTPAFLSHTAKIVDPLIHAVREHELKSRAHLPSQISEG